MQEEFVVVVGMGLSCGRQGGGKVVDKGPVQILDRRDSLLIKIRGDFAVLNSIRSRPKNPAYD